MLKMIVRRVLIAAIVLSPAMCWGATHYVRTGATGNGSGGDWTNAYSSLPSSLTRGDTYYVAGGSYGSHTFSDADSGTSVITILKATVADHGTTTGWQDSYGTTQAVFGSWYIYTDYYTFNGVTRPSDWWTGDLTGYGIKVASGGGVAIRLDNGGGQGGNNLTFRYLDIQAGGRDTGIGDDVIYGLTGNSNITFQYCALHDSDRTIFLTRSNWQNLLVDHCYIARNTSTPATHGEMMSSYQTTGATFSYNIMEDIEGTAFIAGIGNGSNNNFQVYGNVAFHSPAYIADTGRVPGHNFGVSGFVFVAHDATNNNQGNNWQVYNNTLYDIQGTYSGVVIQAGSGNIVQNNMWYNSVRTNNGGGASFTFGYNWYYNTNPDGDTAGTSVTCTTSCNLFVDSASYNFRLAADTSAGLTLASPFNVDPDGNTRGVSGAWDRGAYQLSGSPASGGPSPLGVTPPSNLTTLVR